MNNLSQKRIKQKLFSQVAQSIGSKIRKQIIELKRQSPEKQFSIRRINKIKTQPFNPEEQDKTFWTNPYKTQKQKWNYQSQSKSFFTKKEDIQSYKKYELQKFKQKLKTSLQDIHSSKQLQIQMNQSRVKSFRSNLTQSCKQKTEWVFYSKQLQAEKMRRILHKKKVQAKIHKRRIELDIEFSKWRRQEEKMLKHKSMIQKKSEINITNG